MYRLTALLILLTACPALGQSKKVEPRLVLAVPLGGEPGKTTKITLRGFHLENAKDVKVLGDAGSAKIVGKGKAPVPDKNPEQVGDTQVEIMLALKDSKSGEPVSLTVVTPQGESKPHAILTEPALAEKEPNDGFRQAHALQLPVLIEGKIDRPRDVDVFRIEGKAGQKLVAEVIAARLGSPLDAILTLYNLAGQEIASNDDFGPSHDARIEVTLPVDGSYYLALIDAHDLGGSLHIYRLRIR